MAWPEYASVESSGGSRACLAGPGGPGPGDPGLGDPGPGDPGPGDPGLGDPGPGDPGPGDPGLGDLEPGKLERDDSESGDVREMFKGPGGGRRLSDTDLSASQACHREMSADVDFGASEPHMTRRRLDAELVRRGLARSREHAQSLISEGRVHVAGQLATKPATQVAADASVVVREGSTAAEYVSRGARKLLGALDEFDPDNGIVAGSHALDAGASTGGFTDVLLRRGATRVLAVDVGYGQLAWSLQVDPRVVVMDRTNIRYLEPADLPYRPDVIVADLSFVSLRLVLPALVSVAVPDAHLIVMVKPQFEVGRERLGKGGVVRDPGERERSVLGVAASAFDLGLGTLGVVASPLPGPSGNVEYFLHLRAGAAPADPDQVRRAVQEGPA